MQSDARNERAKEAATVVGLLAIPAVPMVSGLLNPAMSYSWPQQ